MRKKTNILHYPLLMIGLFLVFASSCKKDGDNLASDNPTNGKTTTVFNSTLNYGTMTDQDGNVYKTITIGKQIWMAENLRTTKYNDGTSIPNIRSNSEWENTTIGAYCNYNNTSSNDTIATFGRLYNWHAVNTGKLAPTGWHVSTDAEWTTLTEYLGGENVAGAKLKETGTTHWVAPNESATNETGFSALPGGNRDDYNGYIGFIGYYGSWWSATELNASDAWDRGMGYDYSNISKNSSSKKAGFSVRCLKN